MATVLPYQSILERSSGPKRQGFLVNEISYSSKISQRAYDGPSKESSRDEVWKVRWKQLEYFTPAEVLAGAVSSYTIMKDFYEDHYLGEVEWKPFEIDTTRIWKIVRDSWRQSNTAGCIFDVSFELKYLYNV